MHPHAPFALKCIQAFVDAALGPNPERHGLTSKDVENARRFVERMQTLRDVGA